MKSTKMKFALSAGAGIVAGCSAWAAGAVFGLPILTLIGAGVAGVGGGVLLATGAVAASQLVTKNLTSKTELGESLLGDIDSENEQTDVELNNSNRFVSTRLITAANTLLGGENVNPSIISVSSRPAPQVKPQATTRSISDVYISLPDAPTRALTGTTPVEEPAPTVAESLKGLLASLQ